jgi:hypothetical protein
VLIHRDIDPAAFADLPAICADWQAIERVRLFDEANRERAGIVVNEVREKAGLNLSHHPLVWRYFEQPGGRYALFVLFRFTAPVTAEADLVITSSRFSFNRRMIFDLAIDLMTEVGVQRLIARIPNEDSKLQHLARRAGFRFERIQDAGDGRVMAIWTITPDDLLAFGRNRKGC